MSAKDTIEAIQSALHGAGFYAGLIDGDWGPLSKQALDDCVAAAKHDTLPPAPAQPASRVDTAAPGLVHNEWPKEEDAASFFGYPANLTQVDLPYPMQIDGVAVNHVTCNVKVAASLRRIFAAILAHYGNDRAKLHADGMDIYDGIYNDRSIRGSSRRSMHAYGAAIDIDAEHNPLGATTGRMPRAVVDIFRAEGWRWGGDYQGRKDWMHFEACV
jgi:hypothetical protein